MSGKHFSLEELAKAIGATVEGDPSLRIKGASDLERAAHDEISFFSNPRYFSKMEKSAAGAIIIQKEAVRPEGRNYLLHSSPTEAFQKILSLFYDAEKPLTGFLGIHPTSVLHPTAKIEEGVTIGPYAVLDEGVTVGNGAFIGSHVFVGKGAKIGSGVILHPHVVIREECVIEDRVIIQPGAIIGSCGYGYTMNEKGEHTKLHHFGNVVIEKDAEIGANTTIDRARFASTRIGEGTKIDNLVQIAHNVEIGKHCLIISQVGIAGSAKIGNHVILAGKVAVNGHIEIADHVMIGACSGVAKSIDRPGKYAGVPVQPLSQHHRNSCYLRKIEELFNEVKALKHELAKLSN